MSIIIKGMEMPVFEHQSWDIRRGADGKWYMVDTNAETSDGEWHEIVPVPPHGDLVDREVLMDDIIGSMVFSGRNVPKEAAIVQRVLDIVGDANAILEAEEVYASGYDTAGNYHWTGTHSGEHIIPADGYSKQDNHRAEIEMQIAKEEVHDS